MNNTDNIGIAEWAGVPEVWLTALMLMGDIGKGSSKVMVYGGASGVGTSLVQLLKMQGYDVHCTVSTDQKKTFMMESL